jgi:hypothetical protein
MAITLTRTSDNLLFNLPDNLIWSDEFGWNKSIFTKAYTLYGQLIIEASERQNGRPITLVGGIDWAWMRRSQLESLQIALTEATEPFALTLHDGRVFSVVPNNENDGGAVSTEPLPTVKGSGDADPSSDSYYVIKELKFLTV